MSSNKDQPPTRRRLREARRRGEVVFSTDVASTTVFVVVVVAIWLAGSTTFGLLRELWLHATAPALLTRPADRYPEVLAHATRVLLWATLPVTGLAALAGIAGSFFQVGGVMAWERLRPDVSRLNPGQGLKRVFSMRNLVNLAKMLLKTALLAATLWFVVRGVLDTALKLGYLDPAGILAIGSHSLLTLFAWAAVVFAAIAGIDYVHARHEFMRQQRMSIDDVRRDHKEAEGDPYTRGRRRGAYYETVYAGLADRVAMASAVIYSSRNAVALQYLGERDLPRVIARGENEMAMQIRRFAAEALVPMEFDAALADRLYDEVPPQRPIPRSLYPAVARLLRWATGAD